MVPPDGPRARLHLLQDDALHPLEIVPVHPGPLRSLPDLAELVITRVRLP